MVTLSPTTSAWLLLLMCCLSGHIYTRCCDAASSALLQAINCSTAGNYTPADAYATNLNELLAALPDSTVSKNGGFFNGTAGQPGAPGTAYALALCSADFARSDCHDCLAAAASASTGLPNLCPGSTTVMAAYDQCLVHYSDAGFFGKPYTDVVYKWDYPGELSMAMYRGIVDALKPALATLNAQASSSPERFAAIQSSPYALVQCTWDLAPDKCKACLDLLASKITRSPAESRTYSCRLRHSNASFAVVPLAIARDAEAKGGRNSTSSSSGLSNSTSTTKNDDKGSGSPSRRMSTGAIVGTAVGAVIVVPSFVFGLICFFFKRPFSHHPLVDETGSTQIANVEGTLTTESTVLDATQVHTGRQFSYTQLSAATDKFSYNRRFGNGNFGTVYKAELGGISLAVKRIENIDDRAIRNYATEIKIISQLSHPNLVPFIGSCEELGELLLVYELIPHGSLDAHLHGENTTLSWPKRYNITIDIASALLYMHTYSQRPVLHRDIKPSNVMLDENFRAKVCDFGLVRQVDRDRTSHTTTIIGDSGYIDPESIKTGKVSTSSDIYSFGVVLLEIASGQRPVCKSPEDQTGNALIEKFRRLNNSGALIDAADESLNGNFNVEQMKVVMQVGLLCVQDHRKRPSITQVLNYLQREVEAPQLQRGQDVHAIPVGAIVPKEFSYDQLSAATSNFLEKLGEGGYGQIYKGELGTTSVAVKKMIKVDKRAIDAFRTEIQVICQLSHKNLLPLVGWCCHVDKPLLVYKLMQNGSLADYLHKAGQTALDWEKRFNIIVGIASAVAYLHEDSSGHERILHRDIKPGNVMLDESFTAKLGDFGLVRQIDKDINVKTISYGGTPSYTDPEYYRTEKASWQSDVYSFGVVALEIALDEKPKSRTEAGKLTNLFVEKVLHLHAKNEISNVVDERLKGVFNKEQMDRVIWAAVLCVNPDRSNRPSCRQVQNYLEGNASKLEPSSSAFMSRQHSQDYKTCSSSFRKLEMVREAN